MNDFILISDSRVTRLPIYDNNDPLVTISSSENLLVDSRKNNITQCRAEVLSRLQRAQSLLPEGIKLLIIEGYRPLSIQRQYFDNYIKELRQAHTSWSDEKLYHEASKYVSPPEIIPPHSTGGAVDLTLINKSGEMNLGTEVDASPEESDNACFTKATNIPQEALKNRMILIKAMEGAGFINYPTEWWHWSYGDRYWAYIFHKDFALYGALEF